MRKYEGIHLIQTIINNIIQEIAAGIKTTQVNKNHKIGLFTFWHITLIFMSNV